MSHAHEPPSLPKVIVDEAGPSPAWLPFVGLALFVLAALLVAVHQATGGSEQAKPEAAPAAGAAPAAPAADAPAQPAAARVE
jgi:hypothetical protein